MGARTIAGPTSDAGRRIRSSPLNAQAPPVAAKLESGVRLDIYSFIRIANGGVTVNTCSILEIMALPSKFRRHLYNIAPSENSSRLDRNTGRRDSETGLTLVEMIVVLAIIALVAALIVPNVIGRPDQARVTVAKADLKTISSALKVYRLDNGAYPTSEQGLTALAAKTSVAPVPANWPEDGYLAEVPKDPWNRPYIYKSPGDAGGFDLMSYGKDGKAGGEGLDQDLSDKAP